jgi:hypothetical protein
MKEPARQKRGQFSPPLVIRTSKPAPPHIVSCVPQTAALQVVSTVGPAVGQIMAPQNVIILGETGVGKSSIINMVLGSHLWWGRWLYIREHVLSRQHRGVRVQTPRYGWLERGRGWHNSSERSCSQSVQTHTQVGRRRQFTRLLRP